MSQAETNATSQEVETYAKIAIGLSSSILILRKTQNDLIELMGSINAMPQHIVESLKSEINRVLN